MHHYVCGNLFFLGSTLYLHELLEGSEIYLPEVVKPPRVCKGYVCESGCWLSWIYSWYIQIYESTFGLKNLSFKSLNAGVGEPDIVLPVWQLGKLKLKKKKFPKHWRQNWYVGLLSSTLSPETSDCDMLSSKLGISFFSFDFSASEPRASCPSGED